MKAILILLMLSPLFLCAQSKKKVVKNGDGSISVTTKDSSKVDIAYDGAVKVSPAWLMVSDTSNATARPSKIKGYERWWPIVQIRGYVAITTRLYNQRISYFDSKQKPLLKSYCVWEHIIITGK